MKLVGANPASQIAGLEELPGRSNYFIGNDPKKWRTNVPNYAKVRYKGIYPGVDLVYYGNQRHLEYDFVVAPGADPKAIRLGFETGNSKLETGDSKLEIRNSKFAPTLRIDADGDLVVSIEGGELRFRKPVIYQPTGSWNGSGNSEFTVQNSKLIDARYVRRGRNKVGFEIAGYDRTKPLIIDPTLSYSSYLGGKNGDYAYGVAVDASGYMYVTGYTDSADFPTFPPLDGTGPYQIANAGGTDAFVTMIDTTQTGSASLIYSTYLGGSGDDYGYGIAVDASSGNAYVTGYTRSPNFPALNSLPAPNNALQGNEDAFVTKLGPAGDTLLYSTYLGGSGDDIGYGIAVDASGNAYVTGSTTSASTSPSTAFPTTSGAYSTSCGTDGTCNDAGSGPLPDAFVTKIGVSEETGLPLLIYSTYLGGEIHDEGRAIAVDSSGCAYITGLTYSTLFPVGNPYQGVKKGHFNAFVTKLNATGSALVYSTYLGGRGYDGGYAIAVDLSGNAYLSGTTGSAEFPTTEGAFQTTLKGVTNAFVTILNAAGGQLLYSTYLGGSGSDQASGIALDGASRSVLYVTGQTTSSDFPLASPIQNSLGGGLCGGTCPDAFVTELNAAGPALAFSTYLGGQGEDYGSGIAVDSSANIYVAGYTGATDFPTTPGAQQETAPGGYDAFVVKISPAEVPGVSLTPWTQTFPEQAVGTTSTAQTVTVHNVGRAPLVISTVSPGGTNPADFGLSENCFGVALAPAATCTIGVTFSPTAVGTRTAKITITDNDNNVVGSTQTISLSGTGIAAPTTTSISALTVTYNSNASVTVTVTSDAGMVTVNVSLSVDGGTPILQALTGGSTTFTLTSPSAGDYSLSANYAAQGNFAASAASGTLHVNKADQAITFPAPASPAVYNSSFAVAPTASSGLAVAVTPSGACTMSGNTVTMSSGTGVCTLTASQAGNDNYNAAANVARTVQAAKADQTITVSSAAPAMAVYNTTFLVAATASSGLTVSIGVSGVCSLSGGTVTMTSGTGTCAVTFSQAGNANYNAATPIVENTTATKATPTVTFTGAPASANFQSTFTVTTTTNASTTGTITASGSCSITGTMVTMTSGTGTCSLTANWAADNDYLPVTATQSTAALQIAATVTFTGAPASAAYQSTFSVAATTNASTTAIITASGSCSITGTTVTMTTGTGTCSLTASWEADPNYLAASASQPTTAQKATPVITWSNPTDIVYGTALGGAQLNAAASFNNNPLPGSFSYTPAAGTLLPAGNSQNLSVSFTPNDSTDFTSASKTVQINVNQASLTVTAADASRTYGAGNPAFTGTITGIQNADNITATYATSATVTSPVGTYAIVPTLVDPTGKLGNYTVASNNGTLTVTKASLTVTAADVSRTYGAANPAFTGSYSGFVNGETSDMLTGTLSCTSTATATSAVSGSPYPITCSGLTSTNYGISYVIGQLTVIKATPAFSSLTASQTILYGTPSITIAGKIAAGSVIPPTGESVTITISGGSHTASIGGDGLFTAAFDTHAIPASLTAYTITYSYAGDTNFNSAADASTSLTVTAPAVSLSSASVILGDEAVGTASAARVLTLANTGTADLAITSIVAAGDFTQTNTCGTSVATGARCIILVRFNPAVTGTRSGTLTITDSASDSPQVIALSGTGTAPVVSLSAEVLTFQHNINIDCPPKTVALTNSGTGPLAITGIVATGDFTQTNTCGTSLAAGASCDISVIFKPTAEGLVAGAVTITDNAADSPQVVALAGTGLPPCLLITLAQTATVVRGMDSTAFSISDPKPSCHTSAIGLACQRTGPVSCLFNPQTIPPSGSSALTLRNLKALAADALNFRVTGTSGRDTTALDLVVLVSDFSFSTSPASVTLEAGQTASYSLAIAPSNRLTGRVQLSCSGAPAGATCALTPSAVTLDGSKPGQANVQVTTTARALASPGGGDGRYGRPGGSPLLWLLALVGLAALLAVWRLRALKPAPTLALAGMLLLILVWAACGGGGGFVSTNGPSGTPAGSYSLKVTGTYTSASPESAERLSHEATLTLTVN